MSHDVIMPQLGMSQDTAVIVSWCKAVGDPVAKGDVLFEVETDKAVMEVESRHDGFITAIMAEPQQDIPVGDVIAIISADASAALEQPATASVAQTTSPEPVAEQAAAVTPITTTPAPTTVVANTSGRVLASPKAKRLARERGIELSQLLSRGAVEPLHAVDIPMALEAVAAPVGGSISTIQAKYNTNKLNDFIDWCHQEFDSPLDTQQLWASFCSAANPLAGDAHAQLISTCDLHGNMQHWNIAGRGLQQCTASESQALPALTIYDFSASRINAYTPADASTPTLVISSGKNKNTLSLSFSPAQLSPTQAAQWLQGIAQRCQNPLFHLF